jgi:hypothetical protein
MIANPLPDCPFCGKELAYGLDKNGEPDGSIIHGMPMCLTFEALDPLAFITAVRNKIQTKKGIS